MNDPIKISVKIKSFLLCMIFFCSFPLSAQKFLADKGKQEIIPAGDEIYEVLAAVAADGGEVSFATNGPMTVDEILTYLNYIDESKLSSAGKANKTWLLEKLTPKHLGFQIGPVKAGLDLILEPMAYGKSNENIGWLDYGKRPGFLILPFFISALDYLTVYSEVEVSTYESVNNLHTNHTNIPIAGSDFGGNFPRNAYLSTGARHNGTGFLNFQLAKGKLDIHRTLMDSIVVSDNFDDITYGKFTVFNPRVRLASYVAQAEVNKYMYFHHLEGRVTRWLSLSFLEGTMVNAPLELRFLNPLMIFHGFGSWQTYDEYNSTGNEQSAWQKFLFGSTGADSRVSSYLSLAADINPFKNMRIYFIWVLNQLQISYEKESEPEKAYIPNGYGFQWGIEGWIPIQAGFLHIGAEALYTTPWLYIARSPMWSFTRDKIELYRGHNRIRDWMGTPFGPDAIAAIFVIDYSVPGKWNAALKYRFKLHGSQNKAMLSSVDENGIPNYYPTPENMTNTDLKTPSGIGEIENVVSLAGSYHIMQGLSANASLAFVHQINSGNIEGKTEFGVEAMVSMKFSTMDFFRGIFSEQLSALAEKDNQ